MCNHIHSIWCAESWTSLLQISRQIRSSKPVLGHSLVSGRAERRRRVVRQYSSLPDDARMWLHRGPKLPIHRAHFYEVRATPGSEW